MPKRKSTERYDSTDIQGEGSYVVLHKLTVGQIKQMRKASRSDGDSDEMSFDVGLDTIADSIVEWNWVDDNDEPLPLPTDDETIIDRLNSDEVTFLAEALVGANRAKN